MGKEVGVFIQTQRVLGLLALRDVPSETTGVHKLPVLPEDVGRDQHVPD